MDSSVLIVVGAGVATLFCGLFFLVGDSRRAARQRKKKRLSLLPNYLLLGLAFGWFALAVALFLTIQQQLYS